MNISDPCYGRILEKNGKKLPSKLERRSNDELLRYSIRSVMKYLPWFKVCGRNYLKMWGTNFLRREMCM